MKGKINKGIELYFKMLSPFDLHGVGAGVVAPLQTSFLFEDWHLLEKTVRCFSSCTVLNVCIGKFLRNIAIYKLIIHVF